MIKNNIHLPQLNWVLVLILIISSCLRLSGLLKVPASLFSDEVDIGYQVKSFIKTGSDYYGNHLPLQFHSFSDIRTSFPIYATVLIAQLPGVTIDQSIRLTPVIFSLISIIFIYFLTNNLFQIFDLKKNTEKDGLINPGSISSLLLSMTPWFFTYSRTGFELSMLFTFFTCGLFVFTKYIQTKKYIYLISSLILFGLTPMIYSTAKLSTLLIPFLLLTFPGFKDDLLKNTNIKIAFIFLFIPLIIIMLNGGAGQRFSEIAIYTDPTLSSQTNYLRQSDLGKNLIIGSSPNIISKIVHNKPLMIVSSFIKNLFGPISVNYLFVSGAQNLRHALPGWGMNLKIVFILLIFGLYYTIRQKKQSWLCFLLIFIFLSIVPSALTRDGSTHSSRLFLLIFPIILIATHGFYVLSSKKILTVILTLTLIFEFSLYLHEYFVHFPVISERDFHAGLKELVSQVNKYPNRPMVITRTYEPSTIFFLYYSNFPITKAQSLIKSGKLLESIDDLSSFEGSKVSSTNIYLASVREGTKNPFPIKDAIYVLPVKQATEYVNGLQAKKLEDIYMPSGELVYEAIEPLHKELSKTE